MRITIIIGAVFLAVCHAQAQDTANVIRRYNVENARQGVAVDDNYLYVINNTSIQKFSRETGKPVASWTDPDSLLIHMNGGIILGDTLFCAHSNYPEAPMVSSIEYFDPVTLQPLGSKSFGIAFGSLTWIDRYEGYWYAGFAHYTGRGSEPGKDNRWTRLVKFDKHWQVVESYIFPTDLLERFEGRSNSGGALLRDGRILATGHDNYELYLLEMPEKGSVLQWTETIPVGSFGQAFDVVHSSGNTYLVFGIIKEKNQVVVSEITLPLPGR